MSAVGNIVAFAIIIVGGTLGAVVAIGELDRLIARWKDLW